MQLKDFDELVKRDFDNAAVTNAIRQVFKERDELLEACKLVPAVAETLMDELVGKKAANWEIINDGLVKINRALKNAKGPNP